jgi:hypothetical protein
LMVVMDLKLEIIVKLCNYCKYLEHPPKNSIGGVIVSVLAANVVDHGFEPRSGRTQPD